MKRELNTEMWIQMEEKQCKKCLNTFPATLEYFYKSINHSDGLNSSCKECIKKQSTKWKEENYEDYILYCRERDSREEYRKIKAIRSAENRKNGKHLKWQRKNKDKVKKYQEKRRLHKDHNISNKELKLLYDYCNHSCMYCGISESDSLLKYNQKLHKDHADNGGSNGIDNCILACKSCNTSKHTMNLEEWFKTKDFYSEDKYKKILNWLNMWK